MIKCSIVILLNDMIVTWRILNPLTKALISKNTHPKCILKIVSERRTGQFDVHLLMC